ncbi:hypothetical protein [Myroides fluvii]|uniref:hypothetical protein n=1 Tax=Myroides fluvii TaxID=2572594 RepID=UPI00131E71EF|nr:hypothetical protein [Myroides fluvii]
MIDPKLIKILSKVYLHQNTVAYDSDKQVYTYQLQPDNVKEKDLSLLAASGYEVNQIEHYQHNQVVQNLRTIVNQEGLEAKIYHLFIQAIGTGFHRGLQPIISYGYAKHLPDHHFEPFEEDAFRNPCKICGLPKDNWENEGKNLYDLYIGYCRIGGYTETLLDLKEISTFDSIKASKDDIAVFKKLIACIEQATEKETPTDLLQRISKAKILPNSNSTSRTWLLRILAALGILNNKLVEDYSMLHRFSPYHQVRAWEEQLHQEAPNHRTEVNFPLSAWRGKLGINHEIVNHILTVVQ